MSRSQDNPDGLAYRAERLLLNDGFTSTPVRGLYREHCYICRDPEYARMGLPLCYPCWSCGGHVAADDTRCDDCRADQDVWPKLAELASALFGWLP